MKFLFAFFFISSTAFAALCEVDGISDSPQTLTCRFPKLVISLRCDHGVYYLNSSRVSLAYHREVERGPVPLVFESGMGVLTVTGRKGYFQGLQGKCFP